MAAALGGMVSRPEAQEPAQDTHEASPNDEMPAVAPVSTVAPDSQVTVQKSSSESISGLETGSEYRRTGTGYVKTDGTELVRTVVMMTEGERRRLKMNAVAEGVSSSDYVRRALGFLPDSP